MEIDGEWATIFRKPIQETRSIVELLSGVPIFSLLSRHEFELLGQIVHQRHYAPGEMVIKYGRRQNGFYLVCSGAVEIVSRGLGESRKILGILSVGALIGEFTLIDSAPRDTSIVASQPSEIICFFNSDLMDILDTRPAVGCRILLRLTEMMSRRLADDYARLRAEGYPWEPESQSSPLDIQAKW